MKIISRTAAGVARKAWLWRNRRVFGEIERAPQPRLLVDVSTIIQHDAKTGIQRVVRSVWSELSRRNGRGFLLRPVFATAAHGYCYAPPDFLDRRSRVCSGEPAKVGPDDKFLGLDLSAHLLPRYRSQLKAWRRCGATAHVVVYDLLPLIRPDWFHDTSASNFRAWFDVVARDSDQAICISDHVQHDLSRCLADHRQRGPAMARMWLGSDIAASVPSKGLSPQLFYVLERLRFRPAILMVGTIEPRKGYEAALAAFEELWCSHRGRAPDLVIVGKPGWKTAAFQAKLRTHAEHGARLHWLTDVSDEGLCRLYDSCAGVLVASEAEGFGLPLVEAAAFRRHVLARNLPVFREQRLPNVNFFDDERPAALAEGLLELAELAKAGRAPIVNLPTWSTCVDGLLRELGIEAPLRKAS
jgi:glycosyltransferase involved in cell wall biosynthesis